MGHADDLQEPEGSHILGQRDGIDVVDEQKRRKEQHPYHQEYHQDNIRLEEAAQIRGDKGVVDLGALLPTGGLPLGQPLHDCVQPPVYSEAAVKLHHDAQLQFLRHVLSIQRYRRGRHVRLAVVEAGDGVGSLQRFRNLYALNEKPDPVANGKRGERLPAEQNLIQPLGEPSLG